MKTKKSFFSVIIQIFFLNILLFAGCLCEFSPCVYPTQVSIYITPDKVFTYKDSTVTFKIFLNALDKDSKLGDFTISNAKGEVIFEKRCTGTVDTISYNFLVPDDVESDSTIFLKFEVEDANSGMITNSYAEITIQKCIPDLSIGTFTLNYNNGSLTSWNASTPFLGISVADVTVMTPAASVTDIDVALSTQTTYGLVLVSPNANWFQNMANANTNVGWSANEKNETKLQKINSVSWDSVTYNFLTTMIVVPTYVAGVAANGIAATNIVSGDFVAFETFDGIKGVFKVCSTKSDIKGNKATATITCEIKYIEAGSATK